MLFNSCNRIVVTTVAIRVADRSAATMNAPSHARSAINVVLPPGAAHRSSTRSPRLTSIAGRRVATLRPVNKSHQRRSARAPPTSLRKHATLHRQPQTIQVPRPPHSVSTRSLIDSLDSRPLETPSAARCCSRVQTLPPLQHQTTSPNVQSTKPDAKFAIAIFSSGSETSAAGSYSASRTARRNTALTNAVAELSRATRTRLTDSLTAAEAGMRVRNRKLVKTEPQRNANRRIQTLNTSLRKVFDDLVEKQLPAQHTENKLVTQCSIGRLQMWFFCSKQN